MRKTRFATLVQRARKVNAVLERESNRKYTLYSNTLFVEDECNNLAEVVDCLESLESRAAASVPATYEI